MTTKIIFNDKLGKIYQSFIHEEHENDMIEFIFNHEKKKEVCTNTKKYNGVEWFYLKLTKEDVKEIEKTCWYSNNKPISCMIDRDIVIEIFSVQ